MTALSISAGIALIVSLLGTRLLIGFFRSRQLSQPILTKDEANIVVPEHQHKAGTPTMGGVAILAAALVGYLLSHIRRGVVFSDQTLIMLLGVVAMAGLGFIDDYKKVRGGRNRGLFWKRKGWLSFGLALVIATLLVTQTGISTSIAYTRSDLPGWDLGKAGWVIWAALIIFATTNAVNVTDGLDGLAAGSAIFSFFALTAFAFWGFRNPSLYGDIVNPYDLAVLGASFAGACIGFLWWNAAPARIYMGDVGSFGIGATIALLALGTNTHLLLPLVAGIYVIEIGSVALQMTSYKLFGGRRIFRIAPIHHHFELGGWPETTVIIRFWLIAGGLVGLAIALYYSDYARSITGS